MESSITSQSQLCCLQRKNHQSDVLQMFGKMYENESLTDVTLMCDDGNMIKAHKMVLSACSLYFESVFDKLTSSNQYPIVIMREIQFEHLKAIIEFMYKGEVTVHQNQLESLLKNAQWLKVKGLTESCNLQEKTNSHTAFGQASKQKKRKRNLNQVEKSSKNKNKFNCNKGLNNANNNNKMYEKSLPTSAIAEPSTSKIQPIRFSKSLIKMEDEDNHDDDSSNLSDEYDIEPSKLLEQTMTTPNYQSDNEAASNNSANGDFITSQLNPDSLTKEEYNKRVAQMLSCMSTPEQPLFTNLIANKNYLNREIVPPYVGFDDSLSPHDEESDLSSGKKKNRKRPQMAPGMPKSEIIHMVHQKSSRITFAPQKRFKCDLWQNFSRVMLDGCKTNFISCNSCKLVLTHTDTSGTNSLRRHKCHI